MRCQPEDWHGSEDGSGSGGGASRRGGGSGGSGAIGGGPLKPLSRKIFSKLDLLLFRLQPMASVRGLSQSISFISQPPINSIR